MYDRNTGRTGRSAASVGSWGTFSSSTMMVMMIANMPSVNASSRPLVTRAPTACSYVDGDAEPGARREVLGARGPVEEVVDRGGDARLADDARRDHRVAREEEA